MSTIQAAVLVADVLVVDALQRLLRISHCCGVCRTLSWGIRMGILNGGKPQECDLPNSPVVLGEVRMGESESGVLRGCQTLVAESASLGRMTVSLVNLILPSFGKGMELYMVWVCWRQQPRLGLWLHNGWHVLECGVSGPAERMLNNRCCDQDFSVGGGRSL